MKILIGGGLIVIIGLLAYISYQIERSSWTEKDKQCRGLLVSEAQQKTCELDYDLKKLSERIQRDILDNR